MTTTQQRIVIAVLALIAAGVYIFTGGSTVALLNRTPDDLCKAYFAYQPEANGWGRDWLGGRVPPTQSRDVQLPIYFGWFAEDRAAGFSGRVVTCDGEEVAVESGLNGKLVLLDIR